MVDIATVQYKVSVVDGKKRHNITAFLEQLSWEENEGEIAARVSFTARNDKTSAGYLSSLLKPGCVCIVAAKHGTGKYREVARGAVTVWNPARQNSSREVKAVCYDGLYHLQKSQDNFYFRSGTGTKARIRRVLKRWKVPLGTYQGPDKKHGKKKYQNRYLSDILLDILEEAVKKGGKKCVLRMEKNKVAVVPRGSNEDVYVFQAGNARSVSASQSTEGLVTRVKILGKPENEEEDRAEATVDGLTKYGIRQRIYTMSPDESLKDAKKAAEEILKEQGNIEKKAAVQCPDVPYIRKGDLVYVQAGSVKGFYYVVGVQHNAASLSMTMDIERAEEYAAAGGKKKTSDAYKAGDTVAFAGGKCYVSANGTKFFTAKAGKAKITKKKAAGKHPFHLVHTNSKSDVYGWVDAGKIS